MFRNEVLNNQTDAVPSPTKQGRTLLTGFLRSLQNYPQNVALELGEERFTYSELWDKAAKIAHALNDSLGDASPVVAILAYRSVAAYSGILGILASGRGYVPLNPKFPVERNLAMLNASGSAALIVGAECSGIAQSLLERVAQPLIVLTPDPDFQLEVSGPITVFTAGDMRASVEPRNPDVSPDATAYLLFTSGSTGIPKGVAVTQGNVSAYLEYTGRRYQLTPQDRCSQNFDLTFDLSVHDLFLCWDAAATLCPFAAESALCPAVYIDDKQLTVWFSVPSVALFASKLGLLEPGAFPSLRWSLFCGEALTAAMASAWQEAAPNSVVENLYGPTEATIAFTHYRWHRETSLQQCLNGIVPIGLPFTGQHCRIVNDDLSPTAMGEPGELCLGGSQVAPGYLDNPEKTRQQFVNLAGSDRIWYRTGDLVKQDEQSCIYYLGRRDHQVKINGYRVELQEIDLVLREAADTELAVAIPWPMQGGSAAGIVAVLWGTNSSRDAEILAACERKLPTYMVPSRVFRLTEVPLNANGKIDRRKIAELLG
ncbi:MAG TPA: amino acid adenylation domain-containing protein [Verrucomicrobiae bacterium]|nr:amino acid adenylation domain-containing protein [Verrucomicrobiae bacterium]